MPDITNYDGRLEQMAYYCEAMLDNIAKVNNAYHDSVENDYKAVLPDNLIKWKGIKQIGGKTIVMNQLNKNNTATETVADVTYTNNGDGTWTVDGTANGDDFKSLNSPAFKIFNGHKYFVKGCPAGGSNLTYYVSANGLPWYDDGSGSVLEANADSNYGYARIVMKNGTALTDAIFKPTFIDLTLAFGSGNEPTLAENFEMFPADTYAFNEGTLLSAGVTSIISKDSSDNVLQAIAIPSEITTLEGYGWSCPGAYNYIDVANKKFVQAVGSRAYEAGDESDATVITDKTNTHYALDEPLVFDVDLPDMKLEVEAGGSVTFENQLGNDYCIPVPVQMEYIGV